MAPTTTRRPLAGAVALIGALALPSALTALAAGDAAPNAASGAVTGATEGPPDAATATFAGGCFWCMEPPFDKTKGVYSTTSGYTGGDVDHPTYEQVSSGATAHAEAVQVRYDPSLVDYATLLDVFWHNIDPLTPDGQFCDSGTQYRSAIFVDGEAQRELAEASLRELETSGRFAQPIVTEIVDAGTFWPAEGYHQDYYEKNPVRYKFYRTACGRDRRLSELWGDAS